MKENSIEEIKIIDINKDNAEEILKSVFDRIELKRCNIISSKRSNKIYFIRI